MALYVNLESFEQPMKLLSTKNSLQHNFQHKVSRVIYLKFATGNSWK